MLKRTVGLKRTAFQRTERLEKQAAEKFAKTARAPMKSRGMKGRAPTVAESRFMDAMGALGCLACAKDGIRNPWASIHHIDGRTKPGAHFLVLDLCAGHHQKGTGEDKTLVAVHPDKARFEDRYGSQRDLLLWAIDQMALDEELLAEVYQALGLEEEVTC